jgi:hypothetical protein
MDVMKPEVAATFQCDVRLRHCPVSTCMGEIKDVTKHNIYA